MSKINTAITNTSRVVFFLSFFLFVNSSSQSHPIKCVIHTTLSYPQDPDKYRLMRLNCTSCLHCMGLTNSFNSSRQRGQQEMEYKHRRLLKVSAVKRWTNTLLCSTDGIARVGVCVTLSLHACIRECVCAGECVRAHAIHTCPRGHTNRSMGPSAPHMIGSLSFGDTSAPAPWWSTAQ